MTQFIPTIPEIGLYVGKQTWLRSLLIHRLKIRYRSGIVGHILESAPGSEKSVELIRRSFNTEQPVPTSLTYPSFFIESCRVLSCEPSFLQERHATHLWIASVSGLTVMKEGFFGQATRLAQHGAGKEYFRAIWRLHLLVQVTKLDETSGLQALPFIDRHSATYILFGIRERSACFLHFGGRQKALRRYGPPKLQSCQRCDNESERR